MDSKYVLLKASGGGGLGDCVKSLVQAILYAKRTDRGLIVDWRGSVYSSDGTNPFSILFELVDVDQSAQIPVTEDVIPQRWQRRLQHSLHEVYTEDGWEQWNRQRTIELYSADLSVVDYPESVVVVWDFDQIDKLSDQPMLKTMQSVCRRHLRFSSRVTQRLVEIERILGCPTVGVHVRASKEFDANKGGTQLDHYYKILDPVMRTLPSSERLLVATDNVDVQSKLTERYSNACFVPKWFGQAGESLHLNDDCPDEEENLLSAMTEIVLLSRCHTLVITPGSSFSELAQAFAAPGQTVLQPKPGFLTRAQRQIKRRLAAAFG